MGFRRPQHRDARHAFAAHGADLDRAAVFHRVQQGDDRGRREIDVVNALPRIAQQLFGAELDEFEMRSQCLPFMGRQCAKQVIAVQVGLEGQHDLFSLVTSRGALHIFIYWRDRSLKSRKSTVPTSASHQPRNSPPSHELILLLASAGLRLPP